MFTATEKRKCIEREIGMRERVYPGLVQRGKIKQSTADRELALMREIAEDCRLMEKTMAAIDNISRLNID